MKRIYITLSAILCIAACQDIKNEQVTPVYDDVMRFDVTTSGAKTKVSAGAFEIEDRIGLYVTDYASETTPMPLQVSGNRANNAIAIFDGTSWTPEQTIYWGDGKSDVYAYHPYSETVSDVNDLYFELAADQDGSGYEASDFLWAKAEGVAQSGGPVALPMKHVMSKLTVRLVAGEGYIGSLPEDAAIHLHSTVSNARIDIEKGSVVKDPYSGAKSIKMRNLGVKTYDDVKAVVYEAIVVPQMLESSVPLLEINSKSVSYLLEDSFNFRPGVAYTYTATMNASTTAIKVEIGCEIEDWNNPEDGDSGEDEEGGDDSGDSGDDTVYTDLSAAGTANSYLVQQAGDYKFKAVIGNTDATVGNVKTVEVLWESFGTDEMPDVGDLIAAASYKDGYICFSTPETFRDGNAVIAAKNSKGTILWSWHIWCAEEGWQEQVYYNDAGTMMDRNLGATSATPGDVGALGLLYQWGRKDPFLGSSSISESVLAVSTGTWNVSSSGSYIFPSTLVEENPMTFYCSGTFLKDGAWDSTKTVYDPCPAGWCVPNGGNDGVWSRASDTSSLFSPTGLWSSEAGGVNFSGKFGDDETIWYPASGSCDYGDGRLSSVGGSGGYWSCFPVGNSNVSASYLNFNDGGINPSSDHVRAEGSSVRCQKE